jgi:hypothetical protein
MNDHHHHHHHHQITKLSHSINAIGPAPHWSGRKMNDVLLRAANDHLGGG